MRPTKEELDDMRSRLTEYETTESDSVDWYWTDTKKLFAEIDALTAERDAALAEADREREMQRKVTLWAEEREEKAFKAGCCYGYTICRAVIGTGDFPPDRDDLAYVRTARSDQIDLSWIYYKREEGEK